MGNYLLTSWKTISPHEQPELSIPSASDIRKAGLVDDLEEDPEEEDIQVDGLEEQEIPVDGASELREADIFYQSINKIYQISRAQRTRSSPLPQTTTSLK